MEGRAGLVPLIAASGNKLMGRDELVPPLTNGVRSVLLDMAILLVSEPGRLEPGSSRCSSTCHYNFRGGEAAYPNVGAAKLELGFGAARGEQHVTSRL